MSRCQFLSLSLLDVCFFPFTLFPLWSSDWCGLWLNRGSLPELKAGLLIVRVASGQEGSFSPGWRLEFWLLVHSLWSSGGNPLPRGVILVLWMALVDLKPSVKLWPGVLAVGMAPDGAGDCYRNSVYIVLSYPFEKNICSERWNSH